MTYIEPNSLQLCLYYQNIGGNHQQSSDKNIEVINYDIPTQWDSMYRGCSSWQLWKYFKDTLSHKSKVQNSVFGEPHLCIKEERSQPLATFKNWFSIVLLVFSYDVLFMYIVLSPSLHIEKKFCQDNLKYFLSMNLYWTFTELNALLIEQNCKITRRLVLRFWVRDPFSARQPLIIYKGRRVV